MKPKVLVMDSGERFRDLATQMLRGEYATVLPVTSFRTAVETYGRETSVAVIVTDFVDVLGEMPLRTYLGQLRAQREDRRYVPIVGWAHIDNEEKQQCMSDFALDAVVSKSLMEIGHRHIGLAVHNLLEDPRYYENRPHIMIPTPRGTNDAVPAGAYSGSTTRRPLTIRRLRDI